MSSWLLKAALQRIIGCLPRSYWWNGLFQKYFTKGYYPSRGSFEDKLNFCRQHLDYYFKYSLSPRSNFRALELGTGPWPIVPLGLYLCGASEIWTYDVVPLLQRDTLRRTLELFSEFKYGGSLEQVLGQIEQERFSRLEELLGHVETMGPAELLQRLNIHAYIGDARTTTLPAKSVDLIFSTVVLEMIDAEILNSLFVEFRRVASPDGIMSHYVGLADQYASFDKSISPYNFLKYSDRQWNFLNNPIIPHSRLRLADYRELYALTGWNVVEERNMSGSLEDLKKIPIAPKFKKYAAEDLLVLASWLVARPS